jgi:hypothetical protein
MATWLAEPGPVEKASEITLRFGPCCTVCSCVMALAAVSSVVCARVGKTRVRQTTTQRHDPTSRPATYGAS